MSETITAALKKKTLSVSSLLLRLRNKASSGAMISLSPSSFLVFIIYIFLSPFFYIQSMSSFFFNKNVPALVSQNKTGVCSTHLSLRQPRTLITSPASFRVFSSLGSNRDPNGSVLIETTATSSSSLETSAADFVPKSTVSGGVQDVYGEDAATEDMPITPWSLSVARYHP